MTEMYSLKKKKIENMKMKTFFYYFLHFIMNLDELSVELFPNILKGSYDAISSLPFSLECYKLIVHR